MSKEARRCRVCEHGERQQIDDGLRAGLTPRWMARRYSAGLSRRQLTRHRDECLQLEAKELKGAA
jgi:hypothetical protein